LPPQVEPSEPSLHTPSAPESDPERTQVPLSQSAAAEQTDPASPSLQVPANDVAGRMHSRPASQSLGTLHEVPFSPVAQR
jgi:hypothetical protein